jgi:hypothetical protein
MRGDDDLRDVEARVRAELSAWASDIDHGVPDGTPTLSPTRPRDRRPRLLAVAATVAVVALAGAGIAVAIGDDGDPADDVLAGAAGEDLPSDTGTVEGTVPPTTVPDTTVPDTTAPDTTAAPTTVPPAVLCAHLHSLSSAVTGGDLVPTTVVDGAGTTTPTVADDSATPTPTTVPLDVDTAVPDEVVCPEDPVTDTTVPPLGGQALESAACLWVVDETARRATATVGGHDVTFTWEVDVVPDGPTYTDDGILDVVTTIVVDGISTERPAGYERSDLAAQGMFWTGPQIGGWEDVAIGIVATERVPVAIPGASLDPDLPVSISPLVPELGGRLVVAPADVLDIGSAPATGPQPCD